MYELQYVEGMSQKVQDFLDHTFVVFISNNTVNSVTYNKGDVLLARKRDEGLLELHITSELWVNTTNLMSSNKRLRLAYKNEGLKCV